jgi:nitroreductase
MFCVAIVAAGGDDDDEKEATVYLVYLCALWLCAGWMFMLLLLALHACGIGTCTIHLFMDNRVCVCMCV